MTTRRRTLVALTLALGVVAACAGVLGLRRDPPRSFAHRAHVTAGIGCPTCHQGVQKSGDSGALHLPEDRTCTTSGCHDKPHDPRPCLGCHGDPIAVGAVIEARAHLRFSHERHLQGAASGNCMRCHTGVAEGDARLRPSMATCWSCHEHDRVREVRDCDACHVDLAEEGTPPASHLIHDDDFARRHGEEASAASDLCATCHGERFCAACHGVTAPVVPARMRPADPFAASVHRAGFRARHAEEARAQPAACSSCHDVDRCAECHRQNGVAGDRAVSPHPPGWVGLTRSENDHGRAARRDPAACASCHGGAGEALCVSCHKVGGPGGSPHAPGWSSRQPLTALPCRLCHTSGASL